MIIFLLDLNKPQNVGEPDQNYDAPLSKLYLDLQEIFRKYEAIDNLDFFGICFLVWSKE